MIVVAERRCLRSLLACLVTILACAAPCASAETGQKRTQASALSHDDHEMILSLYEADAAQYNKL